MFAFRFKVWLISCHPLKTLWMLFSQSARMDSSPLPPPAIFLIQRRLWKLWTYKGREFNWTPWTLQNLMEAPSQDGILMFLFACLFVLFFEKSFLLFFLCWQEVLWADQNVLMQKLQRNKEVMKSSQYLCTDTPNAKKAKKLRIYFTKLSKCLRSVCLSTAYAHRSQPSWEQKA